ncbi:MAG: hypothetical protein ACWGN1_03280 [Desulfobulbales bacterium]
MEGLLQSITALLDWLYFGLISPLFKLLGKGLEHILLSPLAFFHIPLSVQIVLFAVLTAMLSFAIRHQLKVDMKHRKFRKKFLAKREKQQDIKLVSDWKSRDAMYRLTDEELDEDFNTHLAHHYSQFVMIYLLPLFLVLAWLNSVFSPEKLTKLHGSSYVITLGDKASGIEGLSVTFIFLISYAISLIIGFQIKKLGMGKRLSLSDNKY